MKRVRLCVAICLLGFPAASTLGSGVSASPLQLPAGYENFTTSIDYSTYIAEAVSGSGTLDCKVDSATGLTGSPLAAFISPGTSVGLDAPDDRTKLVLDQIYKLPASTINVGCSVTMGLPTDMRTFTGTVTNPALKDFLGTDTGTVSLGCEMKGSLAVTATISLGSTLGAAKYKATVNSASQKLPFYCSLEFAFAGSTPSTLTGTVEGGADISNTISPNPCDGNTDRTCAPIQLANSVVTITNGTGKFAGLTGSGTYTFTDTFRFPIVEQKLGASVGAASVSSASARAIKAVGASATPAEAVTLSLRSGKVSAAIVHPSPEVGATVAKLSKGSALRAATVSRASCTWTARGKKPLTLGVTRASVSGTTSLSITAKRASAIKKAGIKSGASVTVTARCTSGKKSVSTNKKFTWAG